VCFGRLPCDGRVSVPITASLHCALLELRSARAFCHVCHLLHRIAVMEAFREKEESTGESKIAETWGKLWTMVGGFGDLRGVN
jgi:hypothetical protein